MPFLSKYSCLYIEVSQSSNKNIVGSTVLYAEDAFCYIEGTNIFECQMLAF